MELGKLGSVDTGGGNSEYQPRSNPLLIQGVKGQNEDGSANPMNPDSYLRADVAETIAKLVGATVIEDPNSKGFSTGDVKMLAFRRGKVTVNAGSVGMVMGNDPWKGNQRAKAVEISELLGIDPPDDKLADKIWDALVAAGQLKV